MMIRVLDRHASLAIGLLGLACAGLAFPALAVPVYGTSVTGADLTASRMTGGGGGLLSSGDKWGLGNLIQPITVQWVITDNLNGTFNYQYTWSGLRIAGSSQTSIVGDISHFTLDVSDDCIGNNNFADPGCVTGFVGELSAHNEENGITGAVKFNEGQAIYEFTSNRAPVWGDLCLKNGGGSNNDGCPGDEVDFVWNVGFTDHQSENTNDFIARPNGATSVPEPATLLLLGLALGGLWIGSRRRRQPV